MPRSCVAIMMTALLTGTGVMVSVMAGCAPQNATPSRRGFSGEAPVVVVEQFANGSEVNLVPGQKMVIQLVRNSRERLSWLLVGDLDESVLKPLGQRSIHTVNAKGRRGSHALEELQFEAVRGGEVTLDLAYLPEGGDLSQATNRFFLRVVVDRFVTR